MPKPASESEYKIRETYSETLMAMQEICQRDELSFMIELQRLAYKWNTKHNKDKRK